jgi:hypothetical protein
MNKGTDSEFPANAQTIRDNSQGIRSLSPYSLFRSSVPTFPVDPIAGQ